MVKGEGSIISVKKINGMFFKNVDLFLEKLIFKKM